MNLQEILKKFDDNLASNLLVITTRLPDHVKIFN